MRVTSSLLTRLAFSEVNCFVPRSPPVQNNDVERLQKFIASSRRLFVLTGAGLSTESGIPDYRSEGVGMYARTDRRPIQHMDFVRSAKARQSYWARNYTGWPQFASFQPNSCHHVLSEWEKAGLVHWLVTQNVDALHTKAGANRVTELHGCTHRVMCLNCEERLDRWSLQTMFEQLNPGWMVTADTINPDGDVVLTEKQVQEFKVPDCPSCGGVLKPEVTFFGDNVKRSIVEFVFDKLRECDSVLVAGSSIYVYSGYRFLLRASDLGLPIAIVNIGDTRADHLADLKVQARCGHILPSLSVHSSGSDGAS